MVEIRIIINQPLPRVLFLWNFILASSTINSVSVSEEEMSIARVLSKLNKDIFIVADTRHSYSNRTATMSHVSATPVGLSEACHLLGAPINMLDLDSFSAVFPPGLSSGVDCGDLPAPYELHNLPMEGEKNTRGHAFVIFPRDLSDVKLFLNVTEATTIKCPIEIRVGQYQADNLFLYMLTPGVQEDGANKLIFSQYHVKQHRYVGLVKRIGPKHLGMRRFNIYRDQTELLFWPNATLPLPTSKTSTVEILFPRPSMDGFQFTIVAMKFDAYLDNEENPNPTGLTDLFTNYSGYDVDQIKTYGGVLGYTQHFVNPPDLKWGAAENGEFDGMARFVMDRNADFIIGCIGKFMDRYKVLDQGLGTAYTRYVAAYRSPQRVRDLFTIVQPIELSLWVVVAASLLLVAAAMYFIAVKEEEATGRNLRHWSTVKEASWYAFGTLIGESITRDTRSEGAWALRMVVAVWVTYSFIITSGYGGNLRAFLMKPAFGDVIDSLEKIVASGIEWDMCLYGVENEVGMSLSTDPVIEQIWDGKITVEIKDYPLALSKGRMQEVLDGNLVLMDWMNKVDTSIYMGFTLNSGEPLIEHFNFPDINSWCECSFSFNKFNPHRQRFDEIIQQAHDADIIRWMRNKVRRRYRLEYLESGVGTVLTKDDEPWVPMQLADFYSLLLFFALFTIISVAAYGYENLEVNLEMKRMQKKIEEEQKRKKAGRNVKTIKKAFVKGQFEKIRSVLEAAARRALVSDSLQMPGHPTHPIDQRGSSQQDDGGEL